MFQMLGVFAEFERAIIQERVAPASGGPRRRGSSSVVRELPDLEAKIRAALKAPGRTEGVGKIAKRFGVDPGIVQRASRPSSESAKPRNTMKARLRLGSISIV